MEKIAAKAPLATFMQPLQYDVRLSAAKHSITPAGATARNLDAAFPLRSAHIELQSTLELQCANPFPLLLNPPIRKFNEFRNRKKTCYLY